MRHVVGFTRIPLRCVHRPVTQGLHGDRGDELRCRLSHHDLNRRAFFNQSTAELGRFVTSNAARESQNNVFTD